MLRNITAENKEMRVSLEDAVQRIFLQERSFDARWYQSREAQKTAKGK